MRKIKNWIINRFLPVWAKESLLQEREALYRKIKSLEQENGRLKAYVKGLEFGIRHKRTVKNEENE